MMNNDVILDSELTTKKDEAIYKVFRSVTGTMGPNGNYGLLNHGGKPKVTKDGVSVAKAIKFEDQSMDLVAQVITEAAIKTDRECGDGTTTTVFLIKQFYDRFKDSMSFKTKSRLNQLLKETVSELNEFTKIVTADSELLRELALTTSNNDEIIVDNVIGIFKQIPGFPDISYRKGVDSTDAIEYAKGVQFLGHYANPSFSPDNANGVTVIKEGSAIIIDGSIKDYTVDDAKRFLEYCSTEGRFVNNTLVIFAKEFSNEWLEIFGVLRTKRVISIHPVFINAIGTSGSGLIGDLSTALFGDAAQTHVSFKSYLMDLDNHLTLSTPIQLGGSRFRLLDIETHKDAINKRIKRIQNEINDLPIEAHASATASLMRRRISNLLGGQVTIVVGGETKSDIAERFDRYVDVGKAVQSAINNGILPGIGYPLAVIGDILKTRYPEDTIVGNYAEALGAQLEFLMGERYYPGMKFVNLATHEEGDTPMDINVWDAKLATVTALQAGLTTAIILISTHVVVGGMRSASVSM